eukprot:8127989-Pyramimonas_sp.AAC.1
MLNETNSLPELPHTQLANAADCNPRGSIVSGIEFPFVGVEYTHRVGKVPTLIAHELELRQGGKVVVRVEAAN